MFPRGIKTNITIHIAILLLLAMLLIDFITVMTAQRDLLQSEISKGLLFISAIEDDLLNSLNSENTIPRSSFKDNLRSVLDASGFSCALVLDHNDKKMYFEGAGCDLQKELEILTRQTIFSGKKTTRFFGTTWGVFWKQSRNLAVSTPLFRQGKIIAATSIVLPLDGIYKVLRQRQQILFIYILANALVLTLIGLFLLSKVTVKPVHRLLKRAEEYREDEGMFFLHGNKDNEFNRLSKALNRMLRRISEDRDKLLSTVQYLEKANLDLKQAQKDIIRAEKLSSVGRLSSGIAHEIGNPIGIVMGYLELLKQKDLTDDERKEFIIRTENEIGRIHTVIRRLLDFSRSPEEGLEPVSVHEILNEISQVLRVQPLMSNIILELCCLAEQDAVMANPDQLRQIFLNLMINAADAIASGEHPSEGKIILSTENVFASEARSTQRPLIRIECQDNGPGIAAEHLGNVFDPFFTTKEPGKGTGLGLYVSFMIAEALNGKIHAASQKGRGTTMIIDLPIDRSTADPGE